MLSCMVEFVLTAPLGIALGNMAFVPDNRNYSETSKTVLKAKSALAESIVKLNLRETWPGK